RCGRSSVPTPRGSVAGAVADGEHSAGEPLADVVVGVAPQVHADPTRQEGAEGLSPGPLELQHDRVLGEPLPSGAASHLVAEQGAGAALGVAQRVTDPHGAVGAADRGAGPGDPGVVGGAVEMMVLGASAAREVALVDPR